MQQTLNVGLKVGQGGRGHVRERHLLYRISRGTSRNNIGCDGVDVNSSLQRTFPTAPSPTTTPKNCDEPCPDDGIKSSQHLIACILRGVAMKEGRARQTDEVMFLGKGFTLSVWLKRLQLSHVRGMRTLKRPLKQSANNLECVAFECCGGEMNPQRSRRDDRLAANTTSHEVLSTCQKEVN